MISIIRSPRFFVSSLFLALLLAPVLSKAEGDAGSAAKTAAAARIASPVKADSKVSIVEKWFFVSPAADKQRTRKKTILMVVHDDQDFGFNVKFHTKKKMVNLKVKLTVPKQPENFPCLTCRADDIKVVGNTVNVNQDVVTASGETYFFWGIGPDDPRGHYELSFSLDNKPGDTYKFEVK